MRLKEATPASAKRALPDGGRWQISNGYGVYPVWARNGRQLFFRSDDNRIMVADYRVSGDSIVANPPRLWSPARLADVKQNRSFDIDPDGKRAAALMPVETEETRAQGKVTFLMNFGDELRRKAPGN